MSPSRAPMVLLVVCWLLVSFSLPARAEIACAGDCGNDGPVTIDELLRMVDIALGTAPLSGCINGDVDHDGEIRIDEILAAVYVAATGCPALAVDAATEGRCDPVAEPCMLPFPNDYFPVADGSTGTGRRLSLVAESLPANVATVHVDPSDQNRADGWSPGSPVIVRIDGLDATRSNLPGLADADRSLDPDSPVVLVDATTGERHPFWAELDAIGDLDETPLLMIHPKINFAD